MKPLGTFFEPFVEEKGDILGLRYAQRFCRWDATRYGNIAA